MAVVSGVVVRWDLSPRIVYFPIPIDEVTMQDLYDTLRDLEDEPGALIYDSIVSGAGKEELGGGVTVGLTITLLNARLAFEGRKTRTATATVTSADTTGRVLTDAGATFQTDGILPGAWVTNLTDGSVASVLTVDSQTQITTDILDDGTDNQFDISDTIRIQNVEQMNVQGGNLVAVDSVGSSIDPILPTVGTQVVRTSSSSATLQELADIQFSSFNGGVTVDLLGSYSGTAYPVGTPRQPVNNFIDALSISASRGFSRLYVIGDATFTGGLDFSGFIVEGESRTKSTFTIDASADVSGAEFYFATISGTLDGGAKLLDCNISPLGLDYVDGFIERCVLNGTITLSSVDTAHFLDCWSGVPGVTTPTIDMAASGSALTLRNYNGGIRLINKSGPEAVSIDMNSGQIILENTVTSGTIVCRGVGALTDNSAGATVLSDDLLNSNQIERTVWSASSASYTAAGSTGLLLQRAQAQFNISYDSNTTTLNFQAWLDRSGATVSAPTSVMISWYDTDATLLFAVDETDAIATQDPDARGVYWFTETQELADDVVYWIEVAITDASGTVTTSVGFDTSLNARGKVR